MRRDDMAETDRQDGMFALAGMAAANAIARRPFGFALGAVIFGVVGYASINALALQDRAHPSAFFETRQQPAGQQHADGAGTTTVPDPRGDVTRIVFDDRTEQPLRRSRIEDQPAVAPPVPAQRVETAVAGAADPMAELQDMLASLGFYDGEVDGIEGPVTLAAIDSYKASVGLRGIDLTTDELLTSLRNNTMVTAAIPTPRERGEDDAAPESPVSVDPAAPRDRTVLKVQAGLKAFGNTTITVDGVAGEHTRAAVREFQALFRMPVTGEIDEDLVARMVAIGLID